MTQSTPAWIVLAHLLRPQGRKGEVLAELFTDFPDRFASQRRVFLAAPGFAGDEVEARSAEVTASWLPVGKNEGRVVLQFAGIDTISDAESIAGLDVLVPRGERLPLEDESVYISELVGCAVYDGQALVGVVDDVQFAMTADGGRRLEDAAPLLVVTSSGSSSGDSSGGDEILIPFAKAFLVNVDTDAKRIEMTLPEGLIEVNRSAGSGGVSEDQKDQKR
jgi:16S rRNA processing protein RimM